MCLVCVRVGVSSISTARPRREVAILAAVVPITYFKYVSKLLITYLPNLDLPVGAKM